MTTIQVIPAKKRDLPEIAKIHAACWQDSYAFLPPQILKNRNENYRMNQWKRWMKSPGEAECLFMIRHEEEGIGFCFAKPNDDPAAPDDAGELHAGYLLPGWRGSAAGPKLMLTMAQYLEAKGKAPLVLWAFRQNPMRIWYAQLGWKKFIERNRIIEGLAIPEFGYVSPPLDQLYARLNAMIASCDARGVELRKKRFYQSERRPHLASTDKAPETDQQTP